MDLSIIMINHNTKKLTEQAVQSIFNCKPQITFEIIIIDNSSDFSQVYDKQQAGVILLQNVENKGFGNACNIGVQKSCGKYVLFLNSDTIMHEGTLEQCVAYLAKYPKVGALGERTLLADGTLDHACKRGFPTPSASFFYFSNLDRKKPSDKKFGAYRQTFVDETSISEVDSIAGSFMMMPREVFDKTAGFDESFFMYGEDLDLCFRIKELGYQVIYYGKASITHLKGQSGLHTKSKTVIYHFYNAMLLFYKKHYIHKYSLFTTTAVYCAIKATYLSTLMRMKLGKS